MKRIFRFALIGTGALVVVLAVVTVAALAVINPNEYKPWIEAAVERATGKQLALQGDLSLSVFPGISIKAGPAELADDASFGSGPFLRVERVSASVAVPPLFSGKVEIGDVTVSGVRLKLAVNKAGENNWAAAGAQKTPNQSGPAESGPAETGKAPDLSAIALESLTVNDTLVTYTDMRSENTMQAAIHEMTLGPVRVGGKTALTLKASCTGAVARPITLDLKAGFTLPASLAGSTSFTAEGALDDTTFSINGAAGLPEGGELHLRGDAAFGDINIDKYTAAPAGAKQAAPTTAKAAPKTALKTDADDAALAAILRKLFLDLHVTVKSVTAANIPITRIEATIKADRGLISAKPVSMIIAEAPLILEAALDARDKTPKSRVIGNWKGARIGQIIRAASGKEHLTGTLDADMNCNASGLNWPAASKTLDGGAAIALTDGTVPAFQLIPSGVPGLPAKTLALSDVRCTSTWHIANGIAKNDDFAFAAAGLAADGNGRINIPAATIDYKLSVEIPTLPELPSLTILPLVVSGPLSSPSCGIDQPELLRQGVKTILDPAAKGGEHLENLGKGLGDMFKGLKK